MRLATAVIAFAFAAGLAAVPSFAMTTSSTPTKYSTTKHVTHHKLAHRGTMHAMASPTVAEHPRVEQLNQMSLQSAKKGQSIAPSDGQKEARLSRLTFPSSPNWAYMPTC
jgi:hypothetical protein